MTHWWWVLADRRGIVIGFDASVNCFVLFCFFFFFFFNMVLLLV